MPDFYEPYETDENLLRLLLFGAGGAGILGILRGRIPRSLGAAARRRNSTAFLASPWWRAAWERFELALAERISLLSRRSGSAAMGELSARLGAGLSIRLADERVAVYATTLAQQLRFDTGAGLAAALAHIWEPGRPGAELIRELEARLGPTARQLTGRRGIHRWERRQIEAGVAPSQILAGVRQRTRAAVRLRAEVMAGDATVRTVSESRTEVFSAAGVLVSSGNPLDDRTEDTHAEHTFATRADPTPAGEPWTASAPLSGLPPYRPKCRCWVESAGAEE